MPCIGPLLRVGLCEAWQERTAHYESSIAKLKDELRDARGALKEVSHPLANLSALCLSTVAY